MLSSVIGGCRRWNSLPNLTLSSIVAQHVCVCVWFCSSSDHFAAWPISKLIPTFTSHLPDYPGDGLGTACLLSPENLLHCIKELSGHRLCPQTRFRSPEKPTQRDSFRLRYTYVSVSAFAFGCMCLCVLACISVCWGVWECVCIYLCGCTVCVCLFAVELFNSLWKSARV